VFHLIPEIFVGSITSADLFKRWRLLVMYLYILCILKYAFTLDSEQGTEAR
jgi:hypothetical protein